MLRITATPVLHAPAHGRLTTDEVEDLQRLSAWMANLGLPDDEHQTRVMFLTLALCGRLGMLETWQERRQALWAGLLHDIGKVLVSPTILGKPNFLTDDERIAIERHPELGARLAQNIAGIDPVVIQAILHHHEAYDGEGYPYGLAGLQIPRLARILSVADVYDALTSDRPYRAAWSHQEAVQYLIDHSGSDPTKRKLFDPVAVWAMNLFNLDQGAPSPV